jgi:putative sterol carrier protein
MPPNRTSAPDPAEAFFEGLAARGSEPLLHATTGSIRFELSDRHKTERFRVELRRGQVKVSRKAGRSDAVVHADRRLFNGIAQGTVNAMAAMLRGAVTIEGEPGVVASFMRVFPGPPSTFQPTSRRAPASGA